MFISVRQLKAIFYRYAFLLSIFCLGYVAVYGQANDNCTNAAIVTISAGGYGTGTFISTTEDITNATVQAGETFAPAILIAGQSQKSIWYKFTLPTTRAIKVTLAQPGNAITAGDVGFTVYKINGCLPGNSDISTKLTPISVFGNTYHPCVDSGVYYVQVSAKAAASGQVNITVESAYPSAIYDHPSQAYNFGTLVQGIKTVTYSASCLSLDDANEMCSGISNNGQYTRSSWQVFTTPAYFDYLVFMVAAQFNTTTEKIYYRIYEGDVTQSNYATLPLVVACDSLTLNNTYYARKHWRCSGLDVNKTYSIALFFRTGFNDNVRVSMVSGGITPTQAPQPISSMPVSNKLGVLPANFSWVSTSATDYFGCNSRHATTACGPSITTPGLYYSPYNYTYNLSSFFTFTLSTTSNISISASGQNCGSSYYIRLFNQDVTNSCSGLDTLHIISQFIGNSGGIYCLSPGTYTVQVMGRDSMIQTNYYSFGSYSDGTYPYPPCYYSDLGSKFQFTINTQRVNAINNYSLSGTGAYDSINVVGGSMQPMVPNTWYTAKKDTFGCGNTVLPWDTACYPGVTKAIYREMIIPDSTILYISVPGFRNKLYKGDASSLATTQNVFTYPQRIQNLMPYTKCLNPGECDAIKVCVVPGTYTHVTFGTGSDITYSAQPSFATNAYNTAYANPANAENLGDLNARIPSGSGSVNSNVDYYTCRDNAVPIAGYAPCVVTGSAPATKAIYRQFYLSSATRVSISGYHYNGSNCGYANSGLLTLFAGKATDGLSTLSLLPPVYRCFTSLSASQCDVLPAGWYTLVSYGTGPSFADPFQNVEQNGYSSYVAKSSQVSISIQPGCAGPSYNRPYKASIDTSTHQPYLIEWGINTGHTAAYPNTHRYYNLNKENFNCTNDTPFAAHPIPNCNANLTKVAYWVFKTTQEAYVQIETKNFWGAVYSGDVRTDSASFATATPIQPCLNSYSQIQICRMQPGTYTLAIFGTSNDNCTNVQPVIYIDQVGYSRFDHAKNAYDFGIVPPDSLWHNGKVGDINPLNAGRAPSNDFIYCTTGAQSTDPTENACYNEYRPQIYNTQVNNYIYSSTQQSGYIFYMPRRNLWYTFVVDKGGYVRVKVNTMTLNKGYNFRFAVYKSDVNGSLPFSQVVSSGEVDSTMAQGLSLIGHNGQQLYWPYYCANVGNEISFYRETCNPVAERYYVLVENPNIYPYENNGLKPNSQVEVSVLLDSVNAIQPLFDHYSQAGNIGNNLGLGTYTGPTDNYSCATRDNSDPVIYNVSYCASKTLWYKFTVNVTGHIKFQSIIGNRRMYSYYDMHLFRMIRPNDSTASGLQLINNSDAGIYDYSTNSYWGMQCISPGTYYIMLTGCNQITGYVYPVIQILEEEGDFCTAPKNVNISGTGSASGAVQVDCHTIGTDYGEFNQTLTCPSGAVKTAYKTSWFKINITGNDTLDITTYLTVNTNALPSDIKYRLMEGNCNAMQERSCVQDALTHDTYKCLPPGSYYVQVFIPVNKNGAPVTGTVALNVSAVPHVDTCAPLKNCLATAVFLPQFDCTVSDTVRLLNLSTYGSTIQYDWDLGYNNQTSHAISPAFVYPALATDQTYTVKLKVINTGCPPNSINTDTISARILIKGRPDFNLGNDTVVCTYGASLQLNASTWPGTTYQWSTGATSASINVTYFSPTQYWVKATYNGCIKRDTIQVAINPVNRYIQNKYLCGNDSVLLNASHSYGETYLWSSNINPWYNPYGNYIYAKTTGDYYNTHNWMGCTTIDTFHVQAAKLPFAHDDTTICYPFRNFLLNASTPEATSYQWSDGSGGPQHLVTAPGLLWVKVFNSNCSVRDTITVRATAPVLSDSTAVNICAGQSYTLPWGQTVQASGLYKDTLRYTAGCDSLVRKINVRVTSAVISSTSASICAGSSYTTPWGLVINTPGSYSDTLRTAAGCDSLVRTVTLSLNTVTRTTNSVNLCAGQTYTLPWGLVVTNAGTYADTLRRSNGGCDSLIRTYQVGVQSKTVSVSNATICSGSAYTLPSGRIVTTAGSYSDTLRYATGCDSLVRTVNLGVQAPSALSLSPSICSGQSYTLPWGQVVSAAGVYRDTLHYSTGCDSVRRTVTLSIKTATTNSSQRTICQGQSTVLPSGLTVNSAGIYRDTLHYLSGCDSLIRVVTVMIDTAAQLATLATICSGSSYTLPWGTVVSASGVYRDTLHYRLSGCDSIRRTVTLQVQAPQVQTTNTAICAGSSYLLPWGQSVSTAGVYKDTLHYRSGCDSIYRTVNLNVRWVTTQNTQAGICAGSSYTLPWGQVVTTQGTYRDTLHYLAGCDSLIRVVALRVYNPATNSISPVICAGQSYTLPSGGTVSNTGIYRDTLHYTTGCDSLIRVVNLTVQNPQTNSVNPVICRGQSYTLPSGLIVTTTGVYKDTLHYQSGCDSLIRVVDLTVQAASQTTLSATICSNQFYTLPSGQQVNTSGQYRDTLHYSTGCDSLVRIVNLTVKSTARQNSSATICSGTSYVLPSGVSVSTSGIYIDTLHYRNGCDSVIRQVNLTVTQSAQFISKDTALCAGDAYSLPWGVPVSNTGIYKDTARTIQGCDSLIRTYSIKVNPRPVVSISKSNDINCNLGVAYLTVGGGIKYIWSPAASLDKPLGALTMATPKTTTVYHVQVTNAEGCSREDSVKVIVYNPGSSNSFDVPNAFTPNGDGKNDCFGVRHWGAVTDLKFYIYSRWGELVFYTEDPKQCWDGKVKGISQATSTFVYIIKANTICGEVLRKGTVTLIQ